LRILWLFDIEFLVVDHELKVKTPAHIVNVQAGISCLLGKL